MKLKYKFELMDLGEQVIALTIEEDANHYRNVIKMNQSGAAIFKLLEHNTSEQEIFYNLSQEYDNSDCIRDFVHDFIIALDNAGVLL